MKIAYKNKRILLNLIIGIVWIILGSSYFFETGTSLWRPYVIITLGVFYLSLAAYEYFYKYITITDQQISINVFPKKKMNIDDIISVNYYAGDYTFTSSDKTIKVLKSQINPKDLPRFEVFLKELTSKLKPTDPL
ncbi:hypothetical protein F3J23_02175 [Chryseobacterium sp. Tr-659]|uniref:hypothetical protein n=1 Tax=Chryseobacterium sp. Tr-659 TaxID=2608340 RepID=UPI0014234620|nr:hypothetical protein [Chryseobacterium sp. Tr-659]NIF04235.1 hypothetical protein [Chryseobacterium sp. Tr-659]